MPLSESPDVLKATRRLLRQPPKGVSSVSAADIPSAPGVYLWSRRNRVFYVGESHRGLRSRLWGNHLRGNARASILRNKIAQAFGFTPTGFHAYGKDAEALTRAKLLECELRFLALDESLINQVQAHLITTLNPPMNDHPGQVPRWRLDEVREILSITPAH
jgi:hypothetical protein